MPASEHPLSGLDAVSDALTLLRTAQEAFFAAVPPAAPWDLGWPELLDVYVARVDLVLDAVELTPELPTAIADQVRAMIRYTLTTVQLRLTPLDLDDPRTLRTILTSNFAARLDDFPRLARRAADREQAARVGPPVGTA